MKFGGTSVEDAAAIRRLGDIVRNEIPRRPLVVVSACAGVTTDLIRAAHAVLDNGREKALGILDRLRTRHRGIIDDLLTGEHAGDVHDTINRMFHELRDIVRGVHLLGELTHRSLDTFTSYGERLSSVVIHAFLCEQGMAAQLVDAREVMITDKSFSMALPILNRVHDRARSSFQPLLDGNTVVVTQGYIGATEDGTTTTIGRGGSDLSAAIFGSVLDAEEIQIWTDVDGMMSADPRIVPGARLIHTMSFDEASELAYFGAKVLHPKTILPAIQKNIPVRVLNSRRPELRGTLITGGSTGSTPRSIKSIACKRGIIVINVSSSRMLMAHGFLARLFAIFADHKKSVDVVATTEVSVSLTVDNEEGLDSIQSELEKIGETRVERQKAIISIVGEGMKATPDILARVFGVLAGARINVDMVSEGASEINLTLVIAEGDVERAVLALHGELFPSAAE